MCKLRIVQTQIMNHSFTYTLGSVPDRPDPALLESKMDEASSSDSSDDENVQRRPKFVPHKPGIEFVVNPQSGRVIKATGRIANRLLNEKLGIGQKQAVKPTTSQKIPEPVKTNFKSNNPQDIWSRYGF